MSEPKSIYETGAQYRERCAREAEAERGVGRVGRPVAIVPRMPVAIAPEPETDAPKPDALGE
jgi:hypothetical protein